MALSLQVPPKLTVPLLALITPAALGYHIASTLYLQYGNTGDVAMPAPIIQVTIFQTHANGVVDQKPLLTLDPTLVTQGFWSSTVPAGFSYTVQVLGSGKTDYVTLQSVDPLLGAANDGLLQAAEPARPYSVGPAR